MGRPEADSSSYDESFQPQEDQYEQTQADFSAHAYETSYDDPSQSHPQMYNNGPHQAANFPPQGPQQMPQAFPPQAFQNPYQAQPQGGQFPPKSPVNGTPVNQQQQAWTTGIFDCLEDPSNALITALFPCVTFGQIAEIVDNGQSTCATNGMMYGLIGMPCLLSCGYRSRTGSLTGFLNIESLTTEASTLPLVLAFLILDFL
uniref:Uncharacterized protein n=1 Tax=Salix viminalis TaxID=40686 RepID=A0A6N2NHY5_SALVM